MKYLIILGALTGLGFYGIIRQQDEFAELIKAQQAQSLQQQTQNSQQQTALAEELKQAQEAIVALEYKMQSIAGESASNHDSLQEKLQSIHSNLDGLASSMTLAKQELEEEILRYQEEGLVPPDPIVSAYKKLGGQDIAE